MMRMLRRVCDSGCSGQASRLWPACLLLMWPLLLLCPAGPAQAAEVRMAFGEKIPPFCFPKTDSGIELEVIRGALAYKGHQLKPLYFPFARIPVSFRDGTVDAAMTDLGQDLSSAGGHYADPAVLYDNVFITLSRRQLKISTPADLKGLSVVSFAGAIKRYPEWLEPVRRAGLYTEINDQSVQVKTLMLGRYDVVLSDRNIFKYFALQLKSEGFTELQPVDETAFVKLNPQDYRPIFRDPRIRDDFNQGLKQLKESGRFQAIYDKYLKD